MNYELGIMNYGLNWWKIKTNYLIHASLFILLVAVLTALLTPPAHAGSCVCNGCSLTGTTGNPAACASLCSVPGCSGGTFIPSDGGSAVEVTPPPPAASPTAPPPAPLSGADAVRNALKGAAEQGTGFPANPSVAGLAGRVVRIALTLVGLVFFILAVYGGVLYLTAGGNEEQVKKSTSTLTRAMIGLVIVLLAGAITQFIVNKVGRTVGGTSNRPEYIDRDLFEDCPEGYRPLLDTPDDEAGNEPVSGAACERL